MREIVENSLLLDADEETMADNEKLQQYLAEMYKHPGEIDRIGAGMDRSVIKALYDKPELMALSKNSEKVMNRQMGGAMAGSIAGAYAGAAIPAAVSVARGRDPHIGAMLGGGLAGMMGGPVLGYNLSRAANLKNYRNHTPEQAQEMVKLREQAIRDYLMSEIQR